jgi:hypothetical protein
MPRIYLALGIGSRSEIFDRHLSHARELGLLTPAKVQPDWWHNPLYCTWGDQCHLGLHGLDKDSSLTAERILRWAAKIRTFYTGEVNFIIDDGYFLGMGDFRTRPELYATPEEFRALIAELKRQNFRVILWYTPFWVVKTAQAVTEHPEWLLRGKDGTLLDNTGDWNGKYHFDWTHPELREHQRSLIRHFLTDLDADGFKIDMTYANPPTREVLLHDASWASGNQFSLRVVEFIHREAIAIKADCFLTFNGVESYLQPYVSAIRLNDLFDFTDCFAWYRRAELVSRLMPGVAIDGDGWPAGRVKMREYPFVASVYGAPVTYYLDGTEVGDARLGEEEINRMASVWAVYANTPVKGTDQILIDPDRNLFERRDANGQLKAVSLLRRIFITYGKTIRLTANTAMAVAFPLDGHTRISKIERVARSGERTPVSFFPEAHQALFFAADAGEGVLYYEIWTERV